MLWVQAQYPCALTMTLQLTSCTTACGFLYHQHQLCPRTKQTSRARKGISLPALLRQQPSASRLGSAGACMPQLTLPSYASGRVCAYTVF